MIRVVGHDPAWAAMFEVEAGRIAGPVGKNLVRLHHIGSTAIPSTMAKPIIDLLLEVSSLQALDQQSPLLEALGYEAKGEFGIPGRRYFRKDDASGTRTHQVHAFEAGGPAVIRHLAFRDFMRAHPAIAAEYGALKERLASAHPHDMDTYIEGKDASSRSMNAARCTGQAASGPEDTTTWMLHNSVESSPFRKPARSRRIDTMPRARSSKPETSVADDLRGLGRMAIDGLTGITDLVEATHAAITHLPAVLGRPAPATTTGLAGFVYRRIRGMTKLEVPVSMPC